MRAEKQLLLDEIQEKIENASHFIVTSYKGFTATLARQFRDKLSATEAEFEVVRKRVFIQAAKKAGINLNVDQLEGHIGVLFTKEDVSLSAKAVMQFSKENNNSIELVAGYIDKELFGAEDVVAIANLPSQKELRAQLVGLIAAPMTQLLGALNAILTAPLNCLEEKSKK